MSESPRHRRSAVDLLAAGRGVPDHSEGEPDGLRRRGKQLGRQKGQTGRFRLGAKSYVKA